MVCSTIVYAKIVIIYNTKRRKKHYYIMFQHICCILGWFCDGKIKISLTEKIKF